MKKALMLIVTLLIGVTVFEFYPAVEHGRIAVPEEVYIGQECGCDCILESRPWYSRLNYWFWLWVIGIPIIIFSTKPDAAQWKRATRTVVAIIFGYSVMNLALHLMWDIRNGPFVVNSDPTFPDQKTWDMVGCANIADGASIVFTLLFGWLYAAIYAGWWLITWKQYHKRKTKLIGDNFKQDWVSKIVAYISKYITIFICLILILIPIALGGIHALKTFGLLE